MKPVVSMGEKVSNESMEASSSLYRLLVSLDRPSV